MCSDRDVEHDDVADLVARPSTSRWSSPTCRQTVCGSGLLQTLAEYGRERLSASGAKPPLGAATRGYFATLLDVADPRHGAAGCQWFATVSEVFDDVRMAIEWAIDVGDADVALTIANVAGWYLEHGWSPRRHVALARGIPRARLAGGARPARPCAGWASTIGMVHDAYRAIVHGTEAVSAASRPDTSRPSRM